MAELITPSQLRLIIPNMTKSRADVIADRINFVGPGYGVKTKDVLREWLANVAHESAGFRIMQEGMNYKPERLVQIWPSRFTLGPDPAKKKKDARLFAFNPQKLANEVYNGRMGNRPGTNDGWDFRGSGPMQTTGKDAAEAYAKYVGFSDAKELMHKVRTEDFWGIDNAFWVFAIQKKLIPLATGDNNFETIVRKINGALIGIVDRKKYFDRTIKFLK